MRVTSKGQVTIAGDSRAGGSAPEHGGRIPRGGGRRSVGEGRQGAAPDTRLERGPATARARRTSPDDHGRDPRSHSRGSVTPVLVDSNVLLDIATADPVWGAWSSVTLERMADAAVRVINPLVYAEVSVGFPTATRYRTYFPTLELIAP